MSPKLQVFQREQAAAAVQTALVTAGDAGVSVQQIKHLINGTLGFACPKSDLGKVLFTAHAKRVSDKYYAMGSGPKKENVETPNPRLANGSSQPLQLEGDLQVTVRGSGYNIKAKARKVILIFSILTAAFACIAIARPF